MRAILGCWPTRRHGPCAGQAGRTRQRRHRVHAADRSALEQLRLSGWDFVASGVNGHRWGLPYWAARVSEVGWAFDRSGRLNSRGDR